MSLINGIAPTEPKIFGRPNISGRLSYIAANDSRAAAYPGSALTYPFNDQHTKTSYVLDYDSSIPADIAIDASLHSSVYQNGITVVQPLSLRSLALIRAY